MATVLSRRCPPIGWASFWPQAPETAVELAWNVTKIGRVHIGSMPIPVLPKCQNGITFCHDNDFPESSG